jgi:hypothetical protein
MGRGAANEVFVMRSLLMKSVATAVLTLAAGPALADAAGVAKGVDPQAEALGGGATRTLVVGADIFLGDRLTTGPEGLVQILFSDNTKLVIGPNSSLLIEDYLIRNNGTAGKLAVDMLAGSFRFITGTSPKGAYEISTPTGTIGVRGTIFDVWIDALTGIAYVMMYRGETSLHSATVTKELSGLCYVGQIDIDESLVIGHADGIEGDERDAFKGHFIFSINQMQLLPQFRVAAATDCTRRDPAPGPNESLLSAPECKISQFTGDCESSVESY